MQDDSVSKKSTTLELSIVCRSLQFPLDRSGPPSLQVHVYLLDLRGQRKVAELGRTELIHCDHSPKFFRKILIKNYVSIKSRRLLFEVYDKKDGIPWLIFKAETTIDDDIEHQSWSSRFGGDGCFSVYGQELGSCSKVATFSLSARDLSPLIVGLMEPSSSVEVYRKNTSNYLILGHRTQHPVDGRNPKFPDISEQLATLCNGDFDREIKFELVDTHIYRDRSLGYFKTTINQLDRNRCQRQVFHLIKTNKDGSSTTTKAKAIVEKFELYERANLSRYMKAAGQLHFVVAIDFSASNGDPNHSSGLHHLDRSGAKNNPYEETLLALTEIVKPYNRQGSFAAFGFGAKFEGRRRQSNHLFALNGNDCHPYVRSAKELLKVYRAKVYKITSTGPANLAPCIRHCNKIASRIENDLNYFVLFILTEGRISDHRQAKKAIAEASNRPVSIMVCGLRDANSKKVDDLDKLTMRKSPKPARRRVFHFAPMNRFIPITLETLNAASWFFEPADREAKRQMLADELLDEIGDHLDSYLCENVGNKFLLDTCRAIGEPDVICEQPKPPMYPSDLFDVMPDKSTVDMQQKEPAESIEINAPVVEEQAPVDAPEMSTDSNETRAQVKEFLGLLAVVLFLVAIIVWVDAR